MSFDLKETYQHYSNVELLRIIQQPDKYRAEAVAAAKLLLEGRTVTEEEQETAGAASPVPTLTDAAEQQESLITDLLDPGLKTTTDAKADQWLNLLSSAILIKYLWGAYHTIKRTIYFATSSFKFPWWTLTGYLDIILMPFILYLVYRRKRLGWILLFGEEVFLLVLRLYQLSASGSDFLAYLGDNATEYFTLLLLNIAACLILWHKAISERLYVNSTLKKKVLFYILAITLLYLLAARFLFPLINW